MPVARAEPPPISGTNTLAVEYRTDNENGIPDDDRYAVAIDRLNLSTAFDDLSLSLRTDAVWFGDPPTPDHRGDVRLERITGTWDLGALQLTAGDYFRQLGRGIVLSLRKVDEVGLDLAIRGGQVEYRGDVVGASLFSGVVNPANLDLVSQRFIEDPEDLLGGGSFELFALEPLAIGAIALYAQPRERLLETERDWSLSAGAWLEAPELVEGLTLYLEADVQERRLAGASQQGLAAYASVDLAAGGFLFLLEGLFLDDFEQKGSRNSALNTRFDYNQPPTLERIDQEIINNRDAAGGRLRVERGFEDGEWIVYANAMIKVSDPGAANALLQLHGYTGFEHWFEGRSSKLFASGGYRDERQDGDRVKSMIHAEAELVKVIGGAWAIHLTANEELRTLVDRRYARGSVIAAVEQSGLGTLGVELGHDTQDPSAEVRKVFVAGILAVDLSDEARLRAVVGTQRGGIKCIAGVCRDFPEFAGGRAELVLRL